MNNTGENWKWDFWGKDRAQSDVVFFVANFNMNRRKPYTQPKMSNIMVRKTREKPPIKSNAIESKRKGNLFSCAICGKYARIRIGNVCRTFRLVHIFQCVRFHASIPFYPYFFVCDQKSKESYPRISQINLEYSRGSSLRTYQLHADIVDRNSPATGHKIKHTDKKK